MLTTLRSWWQDKLLRGVLKNTSFLFSSNTVSAALSMVSSIFATRLLGVGGFGLVATVQTFTSNVNRLLSFRMSEVVVKYLGEVFSGEERGEADPGQERKAKSINKVNQQQAASIVKGIGLIEAATSVLAYGVLFLLTTWAARVLAKDTSVAPLFPLYGLMLLANLVYETSTGVLQTHKRFDQIALINTLQSVITVILILMSFFLKRGVVEVVGAYLIGKCFAGIAISSSAFRQMNQSFDHGWWRATLRGSANWKAILGFAINTNLNGTVNLLTRDNILLYLAWLSPAGLAQIYVGYFKWGLAIINFVTLPIDPFIWPTYAEITRTIAKREWQVTRRLLKRVSIIAGSWTMAAAAGIAVFGWWLIPLVLGRDTTPVYPLTLILLIGYGTANILNWNRPLLLAFGKPSYPLLISLAAGAIEVLLILWLVPGGGYLTMAAILVGYLAVSVSLITWRGWRMIKDHESMDLITTEARPKDAAI